MGWEVKTGIRGQPKYRNQCGNRKIFAWGMTVVNFL